jgi:hypothetical protein
MGIDPLVTSLGGGNGSVVHHFFARLVVNGARRLADGEEDQPKEQREQISLAASAAENGHDVSD